MSATKELTYSDVAEHTSKKDLYVVIHDKVYDTSSFVDEHPYVQQITDPVYLEEVKDRDVMLTDGSRGGEEVMLDVGGQDATEAFEDVGHSDEAREILNGMLIGNLKRQVRSDPALLHLFLLSTAFDTDSRHRKATPNPKPPPRPPPPAAPPPPPPAASA